MEKNKKEIPNILLGYWQGGKRYEKNISDDGIILNLEFDDVALYGNKIWSQLSPDIKLKHIDFNDFFPVKQPLNFEIGIGNGEFITELAYKNSNENFIGVEVFKKSFNQAERRIKRAGLQNVRLIQFDADLILRLFNDNSLNSVYVNFPDPWHKSKHKKRRLLKTFFIELIVEKLSQNGVLHIATDHNDYAQEIAENITQVKGISSLFNGVYSKEKENYFPTKYYNKFAKTNGAYLFRYRKD